MLEKPVDGADSKRTIVMQDVLQHLFSLILHISL